MPSYFGNHFDDVARRLRKEFPTKLKVKIKTVESTENAATVELRNGYWEIQLNRKQARWVAQHSLVHEWAHVLDMESNDTEIINEHRQSWAKIFSKLHTAIFGRQPKEED